MFRNIIYSTCCAVALLNDVCMVESVLGMEAVTHVEESVHIFNRTQFFAMTSEEAKAVKNINFSSQIIDDSFCEHWCAIFSDISFNCLVFNKCSFDSDSFFIFEGLTVKNLTATHCGIEASQAEEILQAIDPYTIRNIDFSYNSLNNDGEHLYGMLCQCVGGGRMHLDTLNLRGNSLLRFSYDMRNVGRIFF